MLSEGNPSARTSNLQSRYQDCYPISLTLSSCNTYDRALYQGVVIMLLRGNILRGNICRT